MLRPPIRAARPNDYTGTLLVTASWIVFALGAVTIALVRLPASWVHSAFDSPELARVLLAVLVLLVVSWVRPFLVARLPRAASLFGRRLTIFERGRRRRLRLDELDAVEIELRPPPVFEAVVVRHKQGTVHEVCPLDWPGAAALYEAIARRLAKRS